MQVILFHTGLVLAALVAGYLLYKLLFLGLHVIAGRKPFPEELRATVRLWYAPVRLLLPCLCILFVLPLLRVTPVILGQIRHGLSIVIIVAASWLLIRITHSIRALLSMRYNIDTQDNLAARKLHTQWRVIERILDVLIVVIGVACVLTTFEVVRNVGVSILASAGVLGIILGFAAQKSLGNLVGGLQIAITQPIRIDDVVIVEGEWGRIEEITLTYVVVRIWDERRLVVPVSHFLENVFQNWTRTSAQLLGTVYLHADYTVSVDAVREELKRIAEASPLWDKRVCVLQVTDAGERSMQLRALVSARNSSEAWELRCHVREALIHYLQQSHPSSLPRLRVVRDPVAP